MVDQSLKESISALIDGQASEVEIHRLLRGLDKNQELRESWGHYQHIGEAIRHVQGYSAKTHVELSKAISDAILAEPADMPLTPVVLVTKRSWLKPVGGLAVAASVTLAAIIGFQQLDSTAENTIPIAAAAGNEKVPVAPQVVSLPVGPAILDPVIESDLRELPLEKQKRLREYLQAMEKRFGRNELDQNSRTVILKNSRGN